MKIALMTTRNEKALAQIRVEGTRPRFELFLIEKEGITYYEAMIINAGSNPELSTVCQQLGMVKVAGKRDRLSILIRSKDEMDAVRNPLKPFFGRE